MKRKFFTLFELLLSLMLLAILLTTLFGWYRHISFGKKKINEKEMAAMEERYFDKQLQKILPKANLKPCFFTDKDGSLIFTFDNGVQSNPALSGTVLGRLFLDATTHTVCLGIWPSNGDDEPFQIRKLLSNVESMRFSFYWPVDPFALAVDPSKVGKPEPNPGWPQSWEKEFGELPPMMKIVLEHPKERFQEFVFDLPQSKKSRILYRKGP